jgi:cyclopropane-fatty-acyl-phospholipid synthase
VHTAIARTLFRRAVNKLPVQVILPEGSTCGGGRAGDPVMRVRDDAFFRRLGADGVIGLGEAYMVEDWDADGDLAELLAPFAARTASHVPGWLQRLRRFYVPRQPPDEENTRGGARTNIHRHYDLSNELFALFLDQSMTYSSALFEPGDSLEEAQRRKIDRLLDATDVGSGTRVLEVGTGWGALAIRAAKRGAEVSTITISEEQQTLARRRAQEAGVADRVDVALCDYRDVQGSYDAVVSVEMIEAVGDRFWPIFFTSLDRVLAPGGAVGIQAILQSHERFVATRGRYTWMNKYIFPGGVLVSVPAVDAILRADTRLRITDEFRFGRSYAATLHEWRARFVAHHDEVEALGFDRGFRRMWELYLAYSEAGFGSGHLDVAQLVMRREVA